MHTHTHTRTRIHTHAHRHTHTHIAAPRHARLLQVKYLAIRCVRTRRFAALSIQRVLEIIVVAVLAGLFWFQRGNVPVLTASVAFDMSGLIFFQVGCGKPWWGAVPLPSRCGGMLACCTPLLAWSVCWRRRALPHPCTSTPALTTPAHHPGPSTAQLLFMSFSALLQALFTFPLDMVMLIKER